MSLSPSAPEELLLDYTTGALSPAMSLLMATHLSMSEGSRRLYGMLEDMGGVLLETLDDEPLEHLTAMSVLEAVDHDAAELDPRQQPTFGPTETAAIDREMQAPAYFGGDLPPSPLHPYAADFAEQDAWQRLGWSVATTQLSVSNIRERAHLLWAKPGAAIATHRHVGREVVLVLKGAFWDEDTRYGPGDIAVGEDGTVHTPRIDSQDECVCLAVTEAPVHFLGSFGWVLNRFCRF